MALNEGKDSVVQVIGKNFPRSTGISADFGGIPARIIASSNSSLKVVVDLSKLNKIETGEEFSEDFVVRVDSTTVLYSQKIIVKPDPEIKVVDIMPKKFKINSLLTLQGNNLNRIGEIEVYFGLNAPNHYEISQMQKATMIPGSRKLLKVKVPGVPGVVEGKPDNLNIKVVSGGHTIYTTLCTLGTFSRPPVTPFPYVDSSVIDRLYRVPAERVRVNHR